MSKKIRLWLYSNNLRDFINKDLKIKKTDKCYYFVSKKQDFVFKEVYISQLSDVALFQIADGIFSEILNLRNNETI